MICGPDGSPSGQGCGAVLKLDTNPTKLEVLAHFGHPTVKVEITEDQFETIFRSAGAFIAGYFPFEEKKAMFWTNPLTTEYDLPPDAYWIKDVKWDPAVTRIGDIFGAESFSADRNELSEERTDLAHQRTNLAWVRTGLAVVAFGAAMWAIQRR